MTPLSDITLVVSLYRSARYLRRFNADLLWTADVVSAAGRTLQVVVVANDATQSENFWLARLLGSVSCRVGLSVEVIRVPRETLYCSWNRGMELAQGDCLGFWNSDDTRNPLALLEGLDKVRSGADVVYFRTVGLKQQRRLLFNRAIFASFQNVPEFDRTEFRRSMHAGPFFLMSRRAWETAGPFDPQLHIAGDFDWCARAAGSLDFVLGREVGGVYARHRGTLSGGNNARQLAENNIVYLRNQAFDKLEVVDARVMGLYRVDLPWCTYEVPEPVLGKVFGTHASASSRREA
jgi:hypothetical protein